MAGRSTKALAIAGVVGVVLAASGAAYAEESENDSLQLSHAKISLTDAVAAAEAKTGGRASRAEFKNAKEGPIFDVEVVAGKAVSDVQVNAETGAVLSVAADKIDSGEQDEEEEEAE